VFHLHRIPLCDVDAELPLKLLRNEVFEQLTALRHGPPELTADRLVHGYAAPTARSIDSSRSSFRRIVTSSSRHRHTTRTVSTAWRLHAYPISCASPSGVFFSRSARCTMSLRRLTASSIVFFSSSSSRLRRSAICLHGLSMPSRAPVT